MNPSGLAKFGPFRIGKIMSPPDWRIWDPSGLAKLGPFRIGKNRTLPDWQRTPQDWQFWDLSGLENLGPFRIGKLRPLRIGKIGILPDWDPSGFVKIACQRLLKISPDTLPDTFSDAIMLLELTRKGVFFVPRPFRIDAQPLT